MSLTEAETATAVGPAARRRGLAGRGNRGRRGALVARSPLTRRRRRAGILLSLPAVALEIALLGVPVGQAVYYSMTQWNGLVTTWIGPNTYVSLLKDPIFWRVLENNGLLLLAVPVAIGIPLAIAALLHEHVRGWRLFRSVYFLPTAISWVVIGMFALRFFSATGVLNGLLARVGFGPSATDMLANEHSALAALAITFIWSMVGTNTIIFLTGMATLDPTLTEAARVDGLSRLQIFFRVTLPLLTRFIQFSFVITVISAFSALFSLIFVMTSGGPGFGTTTLEFFIYQAGFQQVQLGTAALYGVVLFVIMAIAGLVQLRLIKPDDGGGW